MMDPRETSGGSRRIGGQSAMEMLLSPVADARQDDPERTEEFWYTSGPLPEPDSPDQGE